MIFLRLPRCSNDDAVTLLDICVPFISRTPSSPVQCSDPEIGWRDSLQMAGGGPVKSELFKKDRKLCDPRPPGGWN